MQLEASVRASRKPIIKPPRPRANLRSRHSSAAKSMPKAPMCPSSSSTWNARSRCYKDGVMSKSLVEDAEKNYQMALNRQVSGQRTLIVAKAEIAKAEAQVAQAKAALENAEEDLRNSTIVSPIDGLVLSSDVNVGDAVSSILILGSQATLLLTLGDISEVYVQGKVDEADIGKVYHQPARAHRGGIFQRQEIYR